MPIKSLISCFRLDSDSALWDSDLSPTRPILDSDLSRTRPRWTRTQHYKKIEGASDLFYAPVTVGGQSILNGLLDSGSMACTLSEEEDESEKKYWELISCQKSNPECEQFLKLLSCVSRWSGSLQPDKLGSVKLCQAVTLLPRSDLVWGRLPANTHISPGSTVIIEPTTSRSAPRHVLVGCVVSSMWGDRWVQMKILNSTQSPITL
ncbi:Inositol-3-phosphate synthase [Labeo rohita]|uniref:Inositol-3-phosphate synthase n=1 Tax=Labeo rohita TaxID=84645 RepID=A0ABQ8L1S6_LABRO|nr:Inositol-3-phosphate synthase [Labeo rohita]